MKKYLSRIFLAGSIFFASSALAKSPEDYADSIYTGEKYVSGEAADSYVSDSSTRVRKHRAVRKRTSVVQSPQAEGPATPAVAPTVPTNPQPTSSTLRTSVEGREFIKKEEGRVLYIYDDLREGGGEWRCGSVRGTLTIGYGHTRQARGHFAFSCGARITDQRAEELLTEDLGEVEEQVNAKLTTLISQNRFDAIVSLGYNCGYRFSSRVVVAYNSGRIQEARAVFNACTTAQGIRLQGLVDRRRREQAMWDSHNHTATIAAVAPVSTAPITILNDHAYPEQQDREIGEEPDFWAWFWSLFTLKGNVDGYTP